MRPFECRPVRLAKTLRSRDNLGTPPPPSQGRSAETSVNAGLYSQARIIADRLYHHFRIPVELDLQQPNIAFDLHVGEKTDDRLAKYIILIIIIMCAQFYIAFAEKLSNCFKPARMFSLLAQSWRRSGMQRADCATRADIPRTNLKQKNAEDMLDKAL